jgi:hypothetical protein
MQMGLRFLYRQMKNLIKFIDIFIKEINSFFLYKIKNKKFNKFLTHLYIYIF